MKKWRRLIRDLTAQGFTYRVTSKGHIVVHRQGVTVAVIAGTPSDHRSLRNSLADLRRAGYVSTHKVTQ